MSFDITAYHFGQYAAVAPADRADFDALKTELLGELNPNDFLHALLVDELLHASWELARARKYGAPQAFVNRASRNWSRARKTLVRLNTSNVGARSLFEGVHDSVAATCPLANPFAIAKPSRVSKAADQWVEADDRKKLAKLMEQ